MFWSSIGLAKDVNLTIEASILVPGGHIRRIPYGEGNDDQVALDRVPGLGIGQTGKVGFSFTLTYKYPVTDTTRIYTKSTTITCVACQWDIIKTDDGFVIKNGHKGEGSQYTSNFLYPEIYASQEEQGSPWAPAQIRIIIKLSPTQNSSSTASFSAFFGMTASPEVTAEEVVSRQMVLQFPDPPKPLPELITAPDDLKVFFNLNKADIDEIPQYAGNGKTPRQQINAWLSSAEKFKRFWDIVKKDTTATTEK